MVSGCRARPGRCIERAIAPQPIRAIRAGDSLDCGAESVTTAPRRVRGQFGRGCIGGRLHRSNGRGAVGWNVRWVTKCVQEAPLVLRPAVLRYSGAMAAGSKSAAARGVIE